MFYLNGVYDRHAAQPEAISGWISPVLVGGSKEYQTEEQAPERNDTCLRYNNK
jgi:hypothetical protein